MNKFNYCIVCQTPTQEAILQSFYATEEDSQKILLDYKTTFPKFNIILKPFREYQQTNWPAPKEEIK